MKKSIIIQKKIIMYYFFVNSCQFSFFVTFSFSSLSIVDVFFSYTYIFHGIEIYIYWLYYSKSIFYVLNSYVIIAISVRFTAMLNESLTINRQNLPSNVMLSNGNYRKSSTERKAKKPYLKTYKLMRYELTPLEYDHDGYGHIKAIYEVVYVKVNIQHSDKYRQGISHIGYMVDSVYYKKTGQHIESNNLHDSIIDAMLEQNDLEYFTRSTWKLVSNAIQRLGYRGLKKVDIKDIDTLSDSSQFLSIFKTMEIKALLDDNILDDIDKKVLLRLYQGYSISEIAADLEITPSAISQRVDLMAFQLDYIYNSITIDDQRTDLKIDYNILLQNEKAKEIIRLSHAKKTDKSRYQNYEIADLCNVSLESVIDILIAERQALTEKVMGLYRQGLDHIAISKRLNIGKYIAKSIIARSVKIGLDHVSSRYQFNSTNAKSKHKVSIRQGSNSKVSIITLKDNYSDLIAD